jgi:aspartyl-tRNA(Asn)/glutamyl-tRNA(Gln) amidotransferase subunit C
LNNEEIKMGLTREIVENIAELAKLQLTEAEIELYREQLSAILDYADMLSAVETDDIPPTASVLPIRNAFREDVAITGLSLEKALAMAPKAEAQQFSVDAVLDGEG